MARAGPIRNRSTRSKPYERGQRGNFEKQQGWSIFGRIRDFFLGNNAEPENDDSDQDMDDGYSQSMGRVPAIIDEEPSQFSHIDQSTSRFQSTHHSLAMTPRRPGQSLQPPIMSTPLRNPAATPAAESSIIRQDASFNTASPNEALLQFFKQKGDQELSNMEVVGVLSLIGQAVSRNESMVDFSTIHQPDGSNASFDMPSNILSGAHTSTPNVSVPEQYSFRSSPSTSRTWSRSRRGLSSGPKISRSKPATPYSKPSTSQVLSPPSMSNTASTLLEILDEPNTAPSGPLSPRKRKDLVDDSYTKYRPSRSSGLRNTIMASDPAPVIPTADLAVPKAAPQPVPDMFKPLGEPKAPEAESKPQFQFGAVKPAFTTQPSEPKVQPEPKLAEHEDEIIDLAESEEEPEESEEEPEAEVEDKPAAVFMPVSNPPVTLATSAVSTDTIPDFVFDPLPEGEPMDLTPAEQAQVRELETSFTF